VRPERFELPTCCSGGNRSIQLSYGRVVSTVYMGRRMDGNAGALLAVFALMSCGLPAVALAPRTAAAAIPATTASAAALSLRTRFIHVDGTAADLRPVQRRDCLLAIFVTVHFDEAETARSPSITVGHDADAIYLTVCFKELPQFIFARIKAQVTHKDILHASAPALSCRKCELSSANLAGLGGLPENRDRSWQQSNAGGSIAGFLRKACQFRLNLQIG
jgi:hypothetical protein